ncbi:MAG: putative ABC transporter permease [Hungatella sp.]
MMTYTWYQWILFFFIYCFFGWIFESAYVSLRQHHFVNRGFLRLPMLPLYGTGAVMMLWVSLPVRDNLFLVYVAGVVAATALEYVTGWCMERLFKMKYWDYSNQRFQLHGYICLSSSIAWGFLTIFLTEVIHNPVEHLVLSIPFRADMAIILIVGSLFIADTIQSVKAALDLGKTLEAITRIRGEVEELQTRLEELKSAAETQTAELREQAELLATGLKENAAQKLAEFQEDINQRLEDDFPELNARLHALLEYRHSLSEKLGTYRAGLIRRNPTASSARFNEALKELKEYLEELKDSRKQE